MKRFLLAALLAAMPLCAHAQIIPGPLQLGYINAAANGADPTGSVDSTTSINNTLATTTFGVLRNVYLPAGTYAISNALNVGNSTQGQCLVGDGPSTVLQVTNNFSSSALGVIVLSGPGNPNNQQPCVKNLTISFKQPTDIITSASSASGATSTTVTVASAAGVSVGDYIVDITNASAIPAAFPITSTPAATVSGIAGNVITISQQVASPGVSINDQIDFAHPRSAMQTLAQGCTVGSGGTGCKYPWAIYANGAGIPLVDNVLIESSWDGIYLHGTTNNTNSIALQNSKVSALDVGLDIDNIHNFPQINNYIYWIGWGINETPDVQVAFRSMFYDDTSTCANLGAIDGVAITDFQCWTGKLNLTANWSWGHFTNLMMDGTYSDLTMASTLAGGGWAQVANMYVAHGHSPTTNNSIKVSDGALYIDRLHLEDAGNVSSLLVSGGELHVANALIGVNNGGNIPVELVTGGTLEFSNTEFNVTSAACSAINTIVRQSTTGGVLKMTNDYADGPCAGGINAIEVQSDVAGNITRQLRFPGYTYGILAGPFASGPLGRYWGGNIPWDVRVIGSTTTTDTAKLQDRSILWNSSSGSAKAESIHGCGANNPADEYVITDEAGTANTANITITPQGGTINGAATAVISTAHGSLRLICDGVSNWIEQ